jgi:hypothetical protein
MVSFHPIEEEAHLLYYRSVPPEFEPLELDEEEQSLTSSNHKINKPSLNGFIVNNNETLSVQPLNRFIKTKSPSIEKPGSTLVLSSGDNISSSSSSSSSPTVLGFAKSKQKKNSETVARFVFSHSRSSSGTSGSFDSAIRKIIH